MKLEKLKNKKVAVWGYGVDGRATASFLHKYCPGQKFDVLCRKDETDDQPWNFVTEAVTAMVLNAYDVVVKSPGISPYLEPAKTVQCQIISSTALWFDNFKNATHTNIHVIAITGTKGKSTTSAMLTHVLRDMGFEVELAGNFGKPLISCNQPVDYVVLETSSYQAQDGVIKADVAVVLNLYSEHLNWHITEAQYHADKMCLLNQAKHWVLNASDVNTVSYLAEKGGGTQEKIHWFNQVNGFYELNQTLMYQDKALLSHFGWQLKGAHNLVNAAAVLEILSVLKLDVKKALNSLKFFAPLPHRLQPLGECNGVRFINDSISSTPHATLAALKTVENDKTILLVGGFDRGVDWDWWMEAIKKKPPKIILCSGDNGEKIHRLILNHEIKTQSIWQPSLKTAVKTAKELAQAGDVVLLSPGAPSFDAFKDYQHRGQQFAQWVR
ncbi:MAG: UDP-N-acetylmuramoyl-L-alanine--D-glutamate ligase [Marinicella sp.]|nr:UDP-N-acetylmuramoyl-L-alanine--D-glutamate ligase [Xanthomonadales bacterium]